MKHFFKLIFIIQLLSFFLLFILFILDVLNRFSSLYTIYAFLFLVIYRNITISIFSIYTNKYPKNSLNEYKLKNFVNNFEINQDCLFIKIQKKGEVYTTLNGKHNITFDFTNYAFPEKYIIAYIIRQIRFVEINKTLSLNHLFKKRFKSRNLDNLQVDLVIYNINNEKTHINFSVVEDGYFKSSYLVNLINRSKYYRHYLLAGKYQNKSRVRVYTKGVVINEEIYQNGRIVIKK